MAAELEKVVAAADLLDARTFDQTEARAISVGPEGGSYSASSERTPGSGSACGRSSRSASAASCRSAPGPAGSCNQAAPL
jgi:hypothetical protein